MLIDNPIKFFAYCDGYLFSISPHPSGVESYGYYGSNNLYFRGKRGYLPFTSLSMLEKMPLDYLKRYRNLRVVNEVSEDELIKSLKEPENIFDRNTPYRKAYNTFMWIGVGFGGLGGILGYFTSDNFSIVLAIMLISMVFIATALIPHFLFERNKQPHIAYQSRIVMGEMFDLLITA